MRRFLPAAIIFSTFLFFLQNVYSGSVLSSKGIGTPYSFPDSRSMGMGTISIAQVHPFVINRINPAGLAAINTTRLSIQYFLESNRMEDPSGSATAVYSNFDGFSFILPLGSGMGIGTSMMPITKMDYKILFQEKLESETYNKSVTGQGGLNSLDINLYCASWSRLSIGFTAHFIFGRIQEKWIVSYSADPFTDSEDRFDTRSKGFGYTAGVIFKPLHNINIGTIYSSTKNLDNLTEVYYTFKGKHESLESNFNLPSKVGLGISARIKPYLLIGADWVQNKWKDLKFNKNNLSYTRNTNRIAFGAEFFGETDPMASYLKRMAYRLGVSNEPYYTTDPSGNEIAETWFTLGLGIPLMANISQLDIAFGYGLRGSFEDNHLSENLIRISISITGGEKWFVSQH